MDNDDDDDARLHEHVVCADNRGADSVARGFMYSDVVVTNHVPGGIDGYATRASRRGGTGMIEIAEPKLARKTPSGVSREKMLIWEREMAAGMIPMTLWDQ